jgi:spore germination protein YaaH
MSDHMSHAVCRLAATSALLVMAACTSLSRQPQMVAEFWGFTAPWDPRSDATVAAHGGALNAIVSGWIALDSVSLRAITPFTDSLAERNDGTQRRMALVTSYQGARFHPETVRGLAADSIALGRTAGDVGTIAERHGYRGLILDFEAMTRDDLGVLRTVIKGIADSARAHGVGFIGVAIPAQDTVAYPARPLLQATDFLVVMVYDQHWLTSAPGPIATPEWARRTLSMRVGEVGAGKLVAAFPVYGYQWQRDSATAVIGYDDAQRLAARANIPLARDPVSLALHASTDRWNLWVSDAAQLDALVRDARTLGITTFALWRLGLEDPGVWHRVATTR